MIYYGTLNKPLSQLKISRNINRLDIMKREETSQKYHSVSFDKQKCHLHIRHARISDLETCVWIEDVCFSGNGATREKIERRIKEYPDGFLVAELRDQVVGFVNSGCIVQDDISDETLKDLEGHDPSGRNRVIFSLAVHPDFQGRDISTQLMDLFINEARNSGMRSILLICRKKLIRFYNRFGFVYRAPSNAAYGGFKWYEMALSLVDRK
jgi:ribosomal protein S18 acetylase RimI-like enzyme